MLNHAGLPSADGARGWRDGDGRARRLPQRGGEDLGHGRAGRASSCSRVIELFGVERAMFASNYPGGQPAGSFTTIYAGFEEITRGMAEAERRALFHDNAVRIYRMR